MPITFTSPDLTATAVVDTLVTSGLETGRSDARTCTVLDTFDSRLQKAGLRLELHDGRARELVLWGDPTAPTARTPVSGTPAWPADVPPGPLRQRIAAVTRERALLPLLTVGSRVQAVRRVDRRGKATVLLEVHDRIAIDGVEGDRTPEWAVELRSVVGHEDAAELVVTRLLMLGLIAVEGPVADAIAMEAGISLEPRSSSPTVPLEASADALAAYRRVLLNLALTIEDNLQGTIDDTDPEFLHELRVAVRRTRSVLSQAKGVIPDAVRDHHGKAFAAIGQLTGVPRDLDVYLLGWDDQVRPLGPADSEALEVVRTELEVRRRASKTELARALGSRGTRTELDRWTTWLTDPPVASDGRGPVGPFVAQRILRAQRRVLRDGRAITPESDPERLHDLRKDAKKLRYLLECFGGLLEAKPRKAFVAQLKELQENLGDHQDAEVQIAELRDLARHLHDTGDADTDVLLAVGRLSDQLDRRRRHEREAFAGRFAAYDTAHNRRALKALLAPVTEP